MTFTGAIKSGFKLINRQWPLVAVQVGLMFVNCIGLFILVGIPVVIAIIIFGLDMSALANTQDILGLFQNPAELVSKYLVLILVVIASFLFYVMFAATLWLFVFGGTAGFIGRTIFEPSLNFSMGGFFKEAKRMFFPLMWYFLVISLIFIAIVIILSLFGGGIAAIVSVARSRDSTLALFIGFFSAFVFILVSLGMLFIAFAVTKYGVAALFFKGEGAVKSFSEAVTFLWNNQNAFWLYVLLVLGYLLASILMMLITYPFKLIPVVGLVLALPVQLVSSIVQGYLGLVLIAVIFFYYFNAEIMEPEPVIETPADIIPEDSTVVIDEVRPEEGTSDTQASRQEEFPPQKDESEQI
jgi:hypothetical protein